MKMAELLPLQLFQFSLIKQNIDIDLNKTFLGENLKFMFKKKFLMLLKNWWSMAYTVCHAPIQMRS